MLDQKPSTTEPQPGSLELTEELIRRRAYDFYEKRGCEDRHDFDDWLQAEGEILGTATADPEPLREEAVRSSVAA